ncbi:Nickel transport protein NikQ [Neomoorella glycerini]|uniref:Nickel transport protein NikQ n=1 Tax=Neomoorella glycerini TaxID=55779 RepID=A0A6I5ZMW8_9FIRM|nr:cobalt ECF transporter T component CbiQ [Moorella glycerini]QGP90955.1 Nickel transport protein NikQ [Moorella glycerini]
MPAENLPSWLRQNNYAPVRIGGSKRRPGFGEKTLQDLAHFGQEVLFAEELAARRGWLQGLDPRLKLVGLLWLAVVAGLARHPFTLVSIYGGVILLAYLSRIPLGPYLKRVWLFVPLFTGIMVFPSLFNWVRPGEPLVVLLHLGGPVNLGPWQLPADLAITRQGLAGAGLLILRVGVTVSLAFLVTMTTRWAALLRALRVLRVPRIFVLIFSMTYRYIFLLLKTTEEMFTARQSRLVGKSDIKMNRHFLAGAMGNLLTRAYALSEEVYQAMVARGYRGEGRCLEDFSLAPGDYWRFAGIILAGLILLGGDYYLGG